MKKTLFSLAIPFLSHYASIGQMKIAPEVGINFSDLKTTNDLETYKSKSITALRAGVMVEIPILKNIAFESGLMYSRRGGTYAIPSLPEYSKVVNYVEWPLNLKYIFEFKKNGAIFIHVGPYLGYAINGKRRTILNTEKITFGTKEGETRRFDFGFYTGIGYKISHGFYMRAQYRIGLTDISNIDDYNHKATNHSNIALTLGYQF